MQHITAFDRSQLEFSSLDDKISSDNSVRFIDAFVDKLELDKLGFIVSQLKAEGRPSFESSLFLKIYLYGYLNGIRSSRKLERECVRNMEMQWLCSKLIPNYHSIADFRKVNPTALKNTFKLFVLFLKDIDLIQGNTIAIDGTKTRAHNSKKNNYNLKKVERHLKYIEEKSNEYFKQLEENDHAEATIKLSDIQSKLDRLKSNQIKYEWIEQQLEKSGEPQISTTDADSRALLVHGQVVEVCYNVQAAVDEKHKLVVATHTINRNDRNALSNIAKEAKENLQAQSFTAIADKGYHNAREIENCHNENISTIVAQQVLVNSNSKGTTPEYLVNKFTYNHHNDTYTCPQNKILSTKGTWHTKKRDEQNIYQYKKYRTPDCETCLVKHLCTGREKGGREIERSQYAEAVEKNAKRYKEEFSLYRKRQEINEHIFGTIKRVWGYYYTNLKGLEKVNGEWSLIMTVYNIKRSINIVGIKKLLQKINNWKPKYPKGIGLLEKINYINALCRMQILEIKIVA